MSVPARVTHRFLAVAPWIGVPFLLYLFLLRHLWFNAPAWDDYDAILHTNFVLQDAASMREWLGLLLNQHNEHRIAFARLVARSMVLATGHVDFRALVLVANLAWPGLLVLLWLELRDRVPAMLFAGAALLMLQVSYYEASLLSMAGLSNIGAVFFAFACLFFAARGGAWSAAACIACGILAAGSQAGGLFALPIAAAACVLRARRLRAAILAVLAVAAWAGYFSGYVRPAHHPSMMVAFTHPLEAGALFLINVGAIVRGAWTPLVAGLLLLGALAWLARRGAWKVSLVVDTWVVFLVTSIAAATVGRVGFGVFHASRYAIYSTLLLVLALLAAAVLKGAWTRRQAWLAIGACAIASIGIDAWSWADVREYAARGRLLVKAAAGSPGIGEDTYFGVLYPDRARGEQVLRESEKRGLWRAREVAFPPTAVRFVAQAPANAPLGGYVDSARVDDRRLRIVGWSHIPATTPGRTLLVAQAGAPVRSAVTLRDRVDVATVTHIAVLAYGGFALDLEYASADDAKRAAASFCLLTEVPGEPPARLGGTPGCRA